MGDKNPYIQNLPLLLKECIAMKEKKGFPSLYENIILHYYAKAPTITGWTMYNIYILQPPFSTLDNVHYIHTNNHNSQHLALHGLPQPDYWNIAKTNYK